MSRLIDLDEIDPDAIFFMTKQDLISLFKSPGVDAIPVVRCKDCLNRTKKKNGDYHLCIMNGWHRDDFFCADGQRKK